MQEVLRERRTAAGGGADFSPRSPGICCERGLKSAPPPAVIIIGGGMGGLSAAIYLRLAGYEVTIYEANERVGGRANLIERDGFRFDTGPSLLNYPWVFERLFEAAGCRLGDYVKLLAVDPSVSFRWADGGRLTLSSDARRLLAESERVEPGSRPAMLAFLRDAGAKYRTAFEKLVSGNAEDVFGQDLRSGLSVGDTAKRITLDLVILNHTIPSVTSAKPGDFGISGTQTLLMRSKSTNAGGVYYALTQSTDVGPIVFLDFEATAGIAVEPHERWATGLLVDRANVAGNIDLMNRGIFSSGHGWTIGWGVAWNSVADIFIVQRPLGSQNWSIGGRGAIRDQPRPGGSVNESRGAFDSHGAPVAPSSLYLSQLCDRLGMQAVSNIGY